AFLPAMKIGEQRHENPRAGSSLFYLNSAKNASYSTEDLHRDLNLDLLVGIRLSNHLESDQEPTWHTQKHPRNYAASPKINLPATEKRPEECPRRHVAGRNP